MQSAYNLLYLTAPSSTGRMRLFPLAARVTFDFVVLWSFYTGVSPHPGRSPELAVSVAVPLGRQRPFYTLLAFTLLPI